MSALSIQPTYPIFTDIDGQPLEDGFVWIGQANLDPQVNPINVFWDAALTIPAGQPIRTLGGYPSNSGTPARLYVDSDYSIRVMNKNGSVVYSAPAATERYSDAVVNVTLSDLIFTQSGVGAVQRTALSKIRDFVNIKDFGAVGNGVTDDTAAFLNACLLGKAIYIPPGDFVISAPVALSVSLFGESAYEPRSVITLTGAGQLIVNDPYMVWENFLIKSSVNNLAFVKCLHSGWSFSNFRIERRGGATGQIGILFDTTDRSIYFTSLENFKFTIDYPVRVDGNGTQAFNANKLGSTVRDYWQSFASAIVFNNAQVYDANQIAGYFEQGTNVVNLVAGAMRQNRFDLLLDNVTRAYNQSIGLTNVEGNFWTIKNDQFVWGGAYPKNQYYFGVESTKIRASRDNGQTIPNASPTVLTYNVEEFDTLSEFANGSGIFTPRNAGYYQVSVQCTSESIAWDATERWEVRIYKNGANYASGEFNAADAAVTAQRSSCVTTIVYMNGTTDTLDARLIHNQGGNVNTSASAVQNYISISRI